MATQRAHPRAGPPPERAFGVGDWLVEPDLLRLTRGEHVVSVGPKVMGVLVHLAERAGRPVSRDELLEAVWPDVVVVEGVLTRVISQLRHILDDDPKAPAYIETIRSSGYRLIAPVREGARPVDAAHPHGAATGRRGARPRLVAAALVVSAGLVAVLAAGVLFDRGGAEAPGPQPLRPTPATSWPGLEIDGALSPDGQRVAFAWHEDDVAFSDIYVKRLDGDDAVRLTASACPERAPAWSPDGGRVAFLRYEPGQKSTVVVAPADGGDEEVVAERERVNPDLAWAPDGRTLAFSDMATPEGPVALFLLDLATGERRQVTFPAEPQHEDHDPSFSPDGAALSFVRLVAAAERDLHIVALDTLEERRLTHDATIVSGQSWDPRGRGIVMASMRSGEWRLWRVPPSGGEPEVLSVGVDKPTGASFARDVPRLVFANRRVATEIHALRLGGGAEAGGAALTPWIASTGYDHELHTSHDGRRVAFISDRSGDDQVWIAEADGSSPRQATFLEARFVASPRWSPDDREIAFVASPEGHMDVFVLDVATGDVRLVASSEADDRTPSWSRDGTRILFASNRTGNWEAYDMPAAGGEARALTTGTGYIPQEGPDGAVYYLRGDAEGLWRISAPGAEPEHVVPELSSCDWGGWRVTDSALYYLDRRQKGMKVGRLDLATGETRTVFHDPELATTKVPCRMRTLDVAPDESRLALSILGSFESDLLWVDVP